MNEFNSILEMKREETKRNVKIERIYTEALRDKITGKSTRNIWDMGKNSDIHVTGITEGEPAR